MAVARNVDAGGLTPAQAKFAAGLATGMSQSAAYRESYPRSLGWKDETVWQCASRLSADRKVAARVADLAARALELAGMQAGEVMAEVKRLAFSDIGGIYHPDGRLKKPHELDAATRASVASFEIDKDGKIKYRFWDKNAALDKAMRHLGLFEKDNLQQPPAVGTVLLGVLKAPESGGAAPAEGDG
jgi:phage terminase small subunit